MQRIRIKNAIAQSIGIQNAVAQQIGLGNSYKIVIGSDPYEGKYVVIPSNVRQTLPTRRKAMLEDVVIEPIPNNYGLITYNGFEITVS